MVIGDDIGISVLWLVGLQVRMFPSELLARVDGLQGMSRFRHDGKRCSAGSPGLGHQASPTVDSAHLILLGELEAVVGFESLHVFGHVCDGNGRVAEHTWRLEVDTSHFHRVLGVMGGEVCIVQ